MSSLTFLKLNTLPSTFTPNTAYMISKPDTQLFDLYISSTDGLTVRHIANNEDILSGVVAIGPTPPTLPSVHPLWWNTIDGVLFIQYTKEGVTSWVEAMSNIAIPEFAGSGTANTMARSDHVHDTLVLQAAEW